MNATAERSNCNWSADDTETATADDADVDRRATSELRSLEDEGKGLPGVQPGEEFVLLSLLEVLLAMRAGGESMT